METLMYLAGIIFILLGIAFSIGLHELGHLVPAKLFGVKVTKYMIGFGPTIWSTKRGETEYGIKGIPLGGYIAMIGMYPPAKKPETKKGFFRDMISQARLAHSEYETPADANRKFYQLPVLKRIIIMLGGPFMNLVLGVVLTTIALSGFGVYQSSLKIDSVSVCVDSKITNCQEQDQTPAYRAGLQSGDEVLAIDSQAVSNWNEIRKLLAENPNRQLTVLRSGVETTVAISAILEPRPSFDAFGNAIRDEAGEVVYTNQPFLGVFLVPERIPLGLGESLSASRYSIAQIGNLILQLPEQVVQVASSTFGLTERDPNGPISIVGIGQIAGEVAASDEADFGAKLATGIQILGSLNFALFVFNLIPLLPLDGGHVAGGIYEAIKRGLYRVARKPDPGPADTALLMPLTWAMFILLLSISLLFILADLVNPVSLFG